MTRGRRCRRLLASRRASVGANTLLYRRYARPASSRARCRSLRLRIPHQKLTLTWLAGTCDIKASCKIPSTQVAFQETIRADGGLVTLRIYRRDVEQPATRPVPLRVNIHQGPHGAVLRRR